MKRKLSLMAVCLLLFLLSACQSKTVTETHWAAAKKAGGLENYVKEQAENIDMEALKQEAQEGDLEQQFKATALLCALEYRQDLADTSTPSLSRFRFGYPVGSEYATRFLSQVNTDSVAFWGSMGSAFSPYDCYLPIFAAAKELDGPTLVNLLAGDPPGKTQFKEAIDQWVEQNPGKLAAVGEDLTKAGYFDEWAISKWSSTFLHPATNSYRIQADTVEDAFGYVAYLRDVMLPPLVEKNGMGFLVKPSEITGEDYFSSSVMIAVSNNSLTLQEPSDSGLPEAIELEGKTVAAFYYNPGTGEFDDQLPSLQLMGGFLLALPEEEVPATPTEADYYMVLTAHFERGDFYKGANEKDTGTQQVNSLTSVDLYDAASGAFLRHLGNLRELAPDTVYASYDTLPDHQITVCLGAYEVRGVLPNLQPIQQDITPDLLDLVRCLQQVSIGVLDSIIRPANLNALAQHSFLTSSLEVLLPHVGSPPLWEHPAPVPQKQPPKTRSAYFWGIGTCVFGMADLLKAPDSKGFKPIMISPKTHSGNITMS